MLHFLINNYIVFFSVHDYLFLIIIVCYFEPFIHYIKKGFVALLFKYFILVLNFFYNMNTEKVLVNSTTWERMFNRFCLSYDFQKIIFRIYESEAVGTDILHYSIGDPNKSSDPMVLYPTEVRLTIL
jgi:hypothetical protein